MTTLRDPDNVLRTVSSIQVRDSGNVLRTVSGGFLRDPSAASRPFAGVGGMTVTVTPDSAFGYGSSHAPIIITTTSVTASVEGGTAPFTYSWAAEFSSFDAVSPTSATTIFRSDAVGPGDTATDNFVCTVTDAHGQTAASAPIPATASNFGT